MRLFHFGTEENTKLYQLFSLLVMAPDFNCPLCLKKNEDAPRSGPRSDPRSGPRSGPRSVLFI